MNPKEEVEWSEKKLTNRRATRSENLRAIIPSRGSVNPYWHMPKKVDLSTSLLLKRQTPSHIISGAPIRKFVKPQDNAGRTRFMIQLGGVATLNQ
jgi:hypothetical protein